MRIVLYPLILILFFGSCVPVPEDNQEEVIIDLSDPEIQKIYSLQNRQSLDSLKQYFSHKKATYRYLAATAFSSFQTEEAVEELASLLFDKNDEVKAAAAYSLGQIGDESAVQSLLEAFDSDEKNQNSKLNGNILEAVGKCGDKKMLDLLSTTTTYKLEDDELILGQARAIYRYALRNITTDNGTKRMAELVINQAFPLEARVIAANYFYRARNVDFSEFKFQFLKVLNDDSEPRIRMTLANALSRIDDAELFESLLTTLKLENDPRVKTNLIRGFGSSTQPLIVDSLIAYVSHENQGIASSAISVIARKASRRHTKMLRDMVNTIVDSQIRAEVLRAALASAPFSYRNTKRVISDQIINGFNNAGTDYKKAFFLSALTSDPANYQEIIRLVADQSNVVKTMAISPMINIVSSPNFGNLYRTKRAKDKVKSDLINYMIERINNGDLGEIAAAGEWLSVMSENINEVFTDSLALATSIAQLNGPSAYEAKKSLQRALSSLTSYTYSDDETLPTKVLLWETLKNISNTPIAIIVTTKGRITVELTPIHTPATVANFIELTDENYFDRKFIHRVVHNFVIQGGCPRGDGYGSPDYAIRSEVPQAYYDSEGYIGMASAGPHTEGVQWFITHSPTPHLDGKYTIFGKVKDGMDVVNSIQIGDIIQDIRILKYN